MVAGGGGRGRGRAVVSAFVSVTVAVGLACAPIDVETEVVLDDRGPAEALTGEALVAREFRAEFVQMGSSLIVEVVEAPQCVEPRHRPVLRVETVHRSARGFVAWDFALGSLAGGFSALAFARPQFFSPRLIDGEGRVVRNPTPAYVTGGIFATLAALLVTAGIVNAVKARDETHYADALVVEPGPVAPCSVGESPLAEADLRLSVLAAEAGDGDGEYGDDGVVWTTRLRTDLDGRARVRLDVPRELAGVESLPATLEVADPNAPSGWSPRVLIFELRSPWTPSVDAHTGHADTRAEPSPEPELSPER